MARVASATAKTTANETQAEFSRAYDIQLERELLGIVFLYPDLLDDVSLIVKQEHFYDPRHRAIYDACEILRDGSRVIDHHGVALCLQSQKLFDDAKECKDYVSKLVDQVNYGTAHAEGHARMVRDLYQRRELVTIGRQLMGTAINHRDYETAHAVVDQTEGQLMKLMEDHTLASMEDFGAVANKGIEHLHQIKDGNFGLETDLKNLDNALGGLRKTDLIVLAARPGMGKTALACTIALNVANNKKSDGSSGGTVAFFSLEMSTMQLAIRMLAAAFKHDVEKMLGGKMTEEGLKELGEQNKVLRSLPLCFYDTPTLTIAQLRSEARRLKRKKKLSLIVVDYLQLMAGSAESRRQGRVQEVSEISRGLKAIAKELDVPVLAMSQLSRQSEIRGGDHVPKLSDLRDSGSIEQDADIVLLIHRKAYYLASQIKKMETQGEEIDAGLRDEFEACRHKANVFIAKYRNGQTGVITLKFNEASISFESYKHTSISEDDYRGEVRPQDVFPESHREDVLAE